MTPKRFLLVHAAGTTAALTIAAWLLGGPGLLFVAIAALLTLVARFDNHTGSCLLIAIVLLVVIGILLSLLMLTASVGSR